MNSPDASLHAFCCVRLFVCELSVACATRAVYQGGLQLALRFAWRQGVSVRDFFLALDPNLQRMYLAGPHVLRGTCCLECCVARTAIIDVARARAREDEQRARARAPTKKKKKAVVVYL